MTPRNLLILAAVLCTAGGCSDTTARQDDGGKSGSSRRSAEDAKPDGRGAKTRLNVLFFAVDDLRPEIACYGDADAITPNLDRLAASGIRFDRAYCQQAVCSPSRVSLLFGRRPDTTKIYDLETPARTFLGDGPVSLPQHFKMNGYEAISLGKIFHPTIDDPPSWSAPPWHPARDPETAARKAPAAPEKKPGGTPRGKRDKYQAESSKGLSWAAPDVSDPELPDGMTADRAIGELRRLKDKPFFLGVGFLKPHLPFVAPKKYFDLHPPEKFHLPPVMEAPKDSPPFALTTWGELRGYTGIPQEGPLSEKQALEHIRAYHAAATYTDAQVGKVLAELDRLGLAEKTIVVLWGDHGWNLGEHGAWCKHTNYETCARAPLLLRVPGRTKAGTSTRALVEFVDVYPTLAEAAGLPLTDGLEGTSLLPLADDPARPWKSAAFSQYPRPGDLMGYAMKTDRYRYVEWKKRKTGATEAVELYDHTTDPGENVNVAGKPENAATVKELGDKLKAGWKGALPGK